MTMTLTKAYSTLGTNKLCKYTQNMTLMGIISQIEEHNTGFTLKCRSGNDFQIALKEQTQITCIKNLDEVDLDRYATPQNFNWEDPTNKIQKYIREGQLVLVRGVYLENVDDYILNAQEITLFQDESQSYYYENTHWWLTQINCLADTWLSNLFGDARDYDFSQYRTNLDITGAPSRWNVSDSQECATLSRLIYGLSSSYLLTGCQKYLDAAKEGVRYQREHFRSLSHDGRHCFWAFAKQGNRIVMQSQNDDDRETIPLYEQIYALAGLAQYFRITQDPETLEDIERTIKTFDDFYKDNECGGYFSHLDYATLSPLSPALNNYGRPNQAKKNWNSIGDHIPAYLINIILALDVDIDDKNTYEHLKNLKNHCREMLDNLTDLIINKFPPDPNIEPGVLFVNERFNRDWTPDHNWGWQKNRGVVGHNLKISWNLTRAANFYYDKDSSKAEKLMNVATLLGDNMAKVGVDQYRSGIFDCMERNPSNAMWCQFPWSNTKDFWQQEQAILAYLIMYGYQNDTGNNGDEYLQLAREMQAFWNTFFLDHDVKNIYFRVEDDGAPVINSNYGQKASHAMSGYHVFELNYLGHIYSRAYVRKQPFCLYFKPTNSNLKSINILPDFFRKGKLEITRITVNGIDRTDPEPYKYKIDIDKSEIGAEIVVEFNPK